MTTVSEEYKELLDRFVRCELGVEEFQRCYLERFKNESRDMDERLFSILDALFGDIDSFTTDSVLLKKDPTFYLDEQGLRERVARAAKRLSEVE